MKSVAQFATSSVRTVAAGSLAAALALGATVGVGATVQAADGSYGNSTTAAPAKPYGTVTTQAGLNIRQFPSTDSSVKGFLRYRAQVGLKCKVRAQNIAGDPTWYLLRGNDEVWVSGKYLHVTGYVNYCKDVLRSAERAVPNARG